MRSGSPLRFARASVHVTLGALVLLALLFFSFRANAYAVRSEPTDFKLFHLSAQYLLEGTELYPTVSASERTDLRIVSPGEGAVRIHPNLNPPIMAALFSPLGLLKYPAAFRVWAAVSVLAGMAAMLLIAQRLGEGARNEERLLDQRSIYLIAALSLLLYFPTYTTVTLGQLSLALFLAVVLAWMGWREGRSTQAGAILGSIAAIKLFFGVFLLFFLARREWKAAFAFTCLFLFVTALGISLAGPGATLRWIEALGQVDWYASSWNASFFGYFERIFGEAVGEPLIKNALAGKTLARTLSLLCLLLLFVMSKESRNGENLKDSKDLAFSACLVVMLLASPLGWMYYFSLLLLPISVLLRMENTTGKGALLKLATIGAWFLSTLPHPLTRPAEIEGNPGLILGWAGAYTYALVGVLSILWIASRQLPRDACPTILPR